MKYKKNNILSYKNNKKKIIHARVVEIKTNIKIVEFLRTLGLNFNVENMYLLKTKNGRYSYKYQS